MTARAHDRVWPALGLLALALASGCTNLGTPRATGAPDAALDAADAAPTPSPRLAAMERLEYRVKLAGLPVGAATLATTTDETGQALEALGGTNAFIDLLYKVRGLARSHVDRAGRSRTFYLSMDDDGTATERALRYDEKPCIYYRPKDGEPWIAELTLCRRPIDPLALLMLVRALDPSEPPRDFEVAMTLRSYCYRAICVARTDARTGAGKFTGAWVWRVEVRPYDETGEPGEPLEVGPMLGYYTVVVSADERRLPLRIEREFGFGQIALELQRVELAPLAAVAGIAGTAGTETGGLAQR